MHFCFSWLTASCHSASIKLPESWDNNSRKFLKDKFKMVATTGLLWTDYSSNCNVKHTYSKADILKFLLKNVVEENFLSHFTPMPPPIHSLLNFVACRGRGLFELVVFWVPSASHCRMYSTSPRVTLPGHSFCCRARVYHHSLLDSVNGAVTSSLPNNPNIHQTSLHVTEQVKYHYLKW